MSSCFLCPYCSTTMPLTADTYREQNPSFQSSVIGLYNDVNDSTLRISFLHCPKCQNYIIFAKGMGKGVSDVDRMIRPNSLAKIFPEFVPQPIRNDYEEACSILNLSPKASATLSRRCLQGMIRDYWGIKKTAWLMK